MSRFSLKVRQLVGKHADGSRAGTAWAKLNVLKVTMWGCFVLFLSLFLFIHLFTLGDAFFSTGH